MHRYDLTAQMYEGRYSEEQEAKYKKALANINLTKESVVLDVGCGSGLFFRHIDVAKMVVGIDISRKLLFQAKEKTRKISDSHMLLADADHLPFKRMVFSEVFAFTVLQNMPKPAVTLKELRRVAKRSGRFVVTGLKKAFTRPAFMDLLAGSGLQVDYFSDDDSLKCYIAIFIKNQDDI